MTGRYSAGKPILVDVDDQIDSEPTCGLVAKRDHVAEFPGRVDVQQWKRKLAPGKRP